MRNVIKYPVVITGATGFVGSFLVNSFNAQGFPVRVPVRVARGNWPDGVEETSGCDLLSSDNWRPVLSGADTVIHCAGHSSVSSSNEAGIHPTISDVNVKGTIELAELSAAAGVRRFFYLSSAKVLGESTGSSGRFTEQSPCHPKGLYGISKKEAERGLKAISERSEMEVVIVRCPLIYGPGVGGNFRSLMRIANSPWPLPLGGICNRRSFLYLGNLSDFLEKSLFEPKAANDIFLLCDSEDISTSELILRLRAAFGRRSRLWPLPWGWIRLFFRFFEREEKVSKLLDSMAVDASKVKSQLGWKAPYTLSEGIGKTVKRTKL